jgi:linoleate 8R-lipoxygenase/9,12-octadecadienoate 8-hydroperoxide 8S-isomerase
VATLGEGYKYRSADGSGNSLYNEKLGAANTPYSRTVRPEVYQVPVGNLPEPELIFDLLMARGKASGNNGDHPNGISSMLFYLATIIIHDIFQTVSTLRLPHLALVDAHSYSSQDNNSKGYTVNTTSSYVDLAPLYGRNLAEQKAMRTFKDGLLKSDCFSSTRIHGQPSGVGVFLIMFNRFHNYVVTQLALINDGNRFPKPVSDNDPAYAQFDEDLFQTGRLVTTGLYGNIILRDYVRTILNLNRTNSTWALDPRTKEGKNLFSKPAPQGIGNQVSAEFNLIYRWHSAISTRDEKWAIEQFQRLLPGRDPTTANWHDVVKALGVWQAGFEEQAPEERTFAGLQRQDDGSYNDDELVKILQESIDDVAGAFGANRVPDVMRSIEVLGIIQARSWNLCTLNEFRAFVGLTKHKTFEDINPDPLVAKKLRQLYDAPDSVELYPGLVVEKPKPPMVPGSGLCVNFTTSWAILADAVALVRGDRFLTTDYTPDKLTNWGSVCSC